MRCTKCNGEWTPPPGKRITSCPFCGKSLAKENAPKKYENSKDALAAIMKQFGPDVLLGKLNTHFPDLASVSDADKRLVYAVHELGAAKILKSNLNASQTYKEAAVKAAVRELTETHISPDSAQTIIYEFAFALGWKDTELLSQKEEYALYNEKRYAEATSLLGTSAKQNFVPAQSHLGLCYERGQGVTQDYAKAFQWYKKAADQGDADAQKTLADLRNRGYK